MKNVFKVLLTGFLFLSAFSARAYAEDKYSQLASEISTAGSEIYGKKIAIIPFSYADGRAGATKDGSVISERLTIKMINMHKFEIIERSVLDKVMNELKLQSSGVIDASSAKQLGKVLGVEAIVTGTLVEMQAGEIEVNARLIKTETAQAIGASQIAVKKDWVGDATTAQQRPVYQEAPQQQYQQPVYREAQQPVYQQPVSKNYVRQKGQYEYGYFDIFMGLGSPNIALEFENPNNTIYLTALDITGPSNGPYRSVKWDKLETAGFGPLSMRVGGYGNGNVGGAFEFGVERRNIKPQTTTWSLNGHAPGTFTFSREDYLTVTSFYMAGNLMVRFTKKTVVEPYMGLGLGLSLNAISLPYVKGYTNTSTFSTPTDDFGLGLVFNVPFGVRIKTGTMQLVAEMRFQLNTMSFDRGITGESDTITVSGGYFNVGLGFNF
ncbi:MAG TPA: FlgO family outer membrane protein [Elusimicrobiales bacterium]|nr:FlgO family outer membrane protein [Elusimicrobiales bacterium]